MAEPLKNQFGPEIPRKISDLIQSCYPRFEATDFLKETLKGYSQRSLTQRSLQIAQTLQRYLPSDFERALKILMQTVGPKLRSTNNFGMSPFFYLPYLQFIAQFGIDNFKSSMAAQYELTQRFTAEFSIRPFIERYPVKTLRILKAWTKDQSPHVRRLVSEGTRPRLPWASRLRMFQKNPRPVLSLLELLRDDPDLYVRRSVANNLNDIGKDNLPILLSTAERWITDASAERRWIIERALRSAVKQGNRRALAILGYGKAAGVIILKSVLNPGRVRIGKLITISVSLTQRTQKPLPLMIDLRVHFVKKNGKSNPKVFKLKKHALRPGETLSLQKNLLLAPLTTRKHYPGTHRVELMVNGNVYPIGEFLLQK